MNKLSKDRWKIFKISENSNNLVEKGQGCGKSKENGCLASMDDDYVYEGSDS